MQINCKYSDIQFEEAGFLILNKLPRALDTV